MNGKNSTQVFTFDDTKELEHSTWYDMSSCYTCRLRPEFRSYKAKLMLAGLLITLVCVVWIATGYNSSLHFMGKAKMSEDLLQRNYGLTPAPSLQTFMAGPQKDRVYGVVFDAGSTGSRVHVYELAYSPHAAQPYTLLDELFRQVKPGLSAFASHKGQAALSLFKLVHAAKKRIPPAHWSKTPMALRATAGLRLLPGGAADQILQEVRDFLDATPFHLVHDGVSILGGEEEGIYSWVTLNFLSDRLGRPGSSYGALDLGGGSTQITFIPTGEHTAAEAPRGYLKPVNLGSVGSKKVLLYTHSYLGLGLMSARMRMLGGTEGDQKTNDSMGQGNLTSPCLPNEYRGTWEHAGRIYVVTSRGSESTAGFTGCYNSAKRLVTETFIVDHPSELNTRQFFAFSYFFDRAADAGLISRTEGGDVTLEELFGAADTACSANRVKHKFMCMDLTYIVALLQDGYHFKRSMKFTMKKKVKSVELSWGLGALFDVLQKTESNLTRQI